MATKAKQSVSLSNFIVLATFVSILSLIILLLVGRILLRQALLNNRVITKKAAASKQLKANLAVTGQLQDNYQNLGGVPQTAKDALPTTVDFPGLVSSVEAMASSSGVSLKAIDLADSFAPPTTIPAPNTQTSDSPQSAAFSATISANYGGLQQFLTSLELSARPMRVTSINLSGTNNSLQATFQISTYYQPAVVLGGKTEVVK